MQQFSLEKWLENPSRKVVTRRGNPVRIICTDRKHGEDDLPIVFLEESNGGEFLLTCRNDGRCDNYDTQYDLFFADEKEELTEFEKELEKFRAHILTTSGEKYDKNGECVIKNVSKTLLDLARKELESNYYDKVLDDRMVFKAELHATDLQTAYNMGKQDALKDLPRLKKTKDCIDPTIPIMYTNTPSMKSYIEYHGYKLCINDVFDKLPKEE